MHKIAFYIDNNRIADVDCSQIADGNPGIGGTEYLFYFTVFNLQSYNTSDISVTLLTSSKAKLPEMNYKVVGNKQEAIEYCKQNGYDILVIKFEQQDYQSDELLSKTNVSPLKIVVWAHNVIPNHILSRMEKLGGVSAIVNVGREQLDLYRDHSMFYKSTFIYNSLPIKSPEYYKKHSIPFRERGHEVTYLGSLIPVKGFHVLAKVWKDILKEVPDAHLNVIGSGRVYDSNAKLGSYGIAEESYEKEFIPYLTDDNGHILPSVTFWGRLGNEKEKILARTKVGVPNPAGTSETFCLSAVEMSLYGARIVSKRYVGLIDTVSKEVGQLFDKETNFIEMVTRELLDKSDRNDEAWDFIHSNFSSETISGEWIALFKKLLIDAPFHTANNKMVNSKYNFKYLREVNRKLKAFLPFGKKLPTMDYYISVVCQLLKLKFSTPIIKY